MKKAINLSVVIVILLAANFVFAQGMKGEMMEGKMKGPMIGDGMMGGMMKGEMMDRGGMMGMCPMHGMMMKSMMGTSIVATSDGGVVVLDGNKLTKYDKDLNVVKEIEVKKDTEGMQKMMMDMKDKCPMCQKMMGKMGEMKDNASQGSTPNEPISEEEHKSHHPEEK